MIDIIQSDCYRQYNHGNLCTLANRTGVTIHGSGGASKPKGGSYFDGLALWVAGEGEKDKSSFADKWRDAIAIPNYFIDRDGRIYQTMDLNRWSYHSHANWRDKYNICIELINPVYGTDQYTMNDGPYTEDQYVSLISLIESVLKKECKNLDDIHSHSYNYKKYVGGDYNCPGKFFDWNRLDNLGLQVTADGK